MPSRRGQRAARVGKPSKSSSHSLNLRRFLRNAGNAQFADNSLTFLHAQNAIDSVRFDVLLSPAGPLDKYVFDAGRIPETEMDTKIARRRKTAPADDVSTLAY